MDPAKEVLTDSPRNIFEDAFFTPDRGAPVTRTVNVKKVTDGDQVAGTPIAIPGFRSRFVVPVLTRSNPLKHRRKLADGAIDTAKAGWQEEVEYRWRRSDSASVLGSAPPAAGAAALPRLRVTILFGVGNEMHRHGVAAVVARAPAPSLLIVVDGVEKLGPVTLVDERGAKHEMIANNLWGHGITEQTVKDVVRREFGWDVPYDVVVLAAYSTGHAGLGSTLTRQLIDFSVVQRVVIYDCLYVDLAGPLAFLASRNSKAKVIAYVATSGGNSFSAPRVKGKGPEYDQLLLGRKPGWEYVNLYFGQTYFAAAAARVVNEARSSANPIITVLPAAYTKVLDALLGVLPPRLSLISDAGIFQRVRGAAPAGAVSVGELEKSHKKELDAFFAQNSVTRPAIIRGQLLGWEALPLGEDRHDLVLIEFAWEYLV